MGTKTEKLKAAARLLTAQRELQASIQALSEEDPRGQTVHQARRRYCAARLELRAAEAGAGILLLLK